MKNKKLVALTVAPILLAGLNQANAELAVDANIELDTNMFDYADSDTSYTQTGRVEVNVTGEKAKNGYYVKGKVSGIFNESGDAGTDDAWIKFGSNTWDIQAGRFEAIDMSPVGKDTILEHANGAIVYGNDKTRGRIGDDGGQFALRILPSESLQLELDAIYGDDGGDDTEAFSGFRPSISFITDSFTLAAGYEHLKNYEGELDATLDGFGLKAGVGVGDGDLNIWGASAAIEDSSEDGDLLSIGANLTLGNFGIGAILSEADYDGTDEDPETMTVYLAYTLPLLDIDGASMTLGASHSKVDGLTGNTDDSLTALRLRFNYTFN